MSKISQKLIQKNTHSAYYSTSRTKFFSFVKKMVEEQGLDWEKEYKRKFIDSWEFEKRAEKEKLTRLAASAKKQAKDFGISKKIRRSFEKVFITKKVDGPHTPFDTLKKMVTSSGFKEMSLVGSPERFRIDFVKETKDGQITVHLLYDSKNYKLARIKFLLGY